MVKTKRKAGKRGTTADRRGPTARKSGVSKADKPGSRKPKPAKTDSRKQKSSLRSETARLKRQLKAARSQQEASAEILRAVASASGDAAGPLQLIAETTARLFDASSVSIQLAEGTEFTQEYRVGAIAKRIGSAYPRSNIKVGGRNLPGTVVAESRQIHIPDLDHLDPSMSDFPGLPHARAGGARTVCGTPLRREHKAIGALIVFRDRLLPFTDDELALLQSFADQAVIAIQNARLFNETKEALARQTATSEILSVISGSPTDVQPIFDAIVLTAQRLLCREMAFILLCEDGTAFRPVAITGPEGLVQILNPAPIPIDPEANFPSRAIVSKTNQQFPDWSAIDLPEEERKIREMYGLSSALYLPMLRGGECIGVLGLGGRQPGGFSETDLTLAESFRDQAVIAIENTRLFDEVRAKTADLQESLQQQTATADVLKVISRSAFELEPALVAVCETAARLCDADQTAIFQREGEFYRFAACFGFPPEYENAWRAAGLIRNDPNSSLPGHRAVAERRPVHILDVTADPAYSATTSGQSQARTALGVPLMRDGEPIGNFVLARRRVEAFSDRQLELIQTFADQAVIAIENTRLFNETKEALERQTATADILKVIASSPSDVQPVFEAIAERSNRLVGGLSSAVYAIVEDAMHLMAFTRTSPEADAAIQASFPRPLSEAPWADQIRKGEIVEIPDAEIEWSDHPALLEMVRLRGFRCQLLVPLQRDGTTVGLISVTRKQPGTFAPHHVQLLQSFADQAVIAIENVRLFDEVQAKTGDLEESLQQQIATADVLKVISRSAFDLQTVLETLARSAVELSSARRGTVFLRDGDVFRFRAASHPDLNDDWIRFMNDNPQQAGRHSTIGRAIASARSVCTPDVEADPEIRMPTYLAGIRAVLAVPLLRDGKVEGVMALSRQEPGEFTARQIELVETFADQAVIAIENTRLFNETKQALAYQTGSSNVLRVIASSPTDVEPVLKAIVESARELCEANDAVVLLRDAEHLRFSAHSGPIAVNIDKWPISRNWTAGRAFVDQKPVHVHDMLSGDGAEFPDARAMGQSTGSTIHTVLSVPLLRGNESIGAILLRRTEVRPFNDKQINLLSTFADQAVIAIQNARLFNETREALERQTATAEILRVIASSPDDVQPVFQAIAERSNHLVGGFATTVVSIVDDAVHLSAFTSTTPAADAALRTFYPRPLSGFTYSQAIRRGEIYRIVDAEVEMAGESDQLAMVRQRGWRSALWVPLLLEGEAIGVIGVTRVEPGRFADHHVDMLKTFADQAVIAISNVKLFRQVQERTGDLQESLQQQTATAEVLKVISRSAFDLRAVLTTLVRSALELCNAPIGTFFLREGDALRLASQVGCTPELVQYFHDNPIPLNQSSGAGRAFSTGRVVHFPDVLADPDYRLSEVQRLGDYRSLLAVPLLREQETIGVFSLSRTRPEPFSQRQIDLVQTFADQAVIAIENTRLFNETREALERQTATADVLRIISRSVAHAAPVFDTILESCQRLFNPYDAAVYLVEGDRVRGVARRGPGAGDWGADSMPLEGSSTGVAIAQRQPVHFPDLADKADLPEDKRAVVKETGGMTVLYAPMISQDSGVGSLVVTRRPKKPFTKAEIGLIQTFADQAVIAIENARLFEEVQARTRELAASLDDLRTAQDRLVQTEKLASLGQLTAGIAHEIKNPLNFVNNFSALSVELIDEMTDIFENPALDEAGRRKELDEIRELLKSNLEKVVQHGKRADSIVKNMLLHSREGSGEHRAVDINALLDESLNLAYHGARAEKPGFNITLQRDLDPDAGMIELFPQELTRALLNLISNGFYAASKREAENGEAGFEPVLGAATKNLGNHIEIRIRDNGAGIPPEVKEKMFNPFFTTKPAGEGTGLGLSMSHDIIVKQHGGRIEVDTQPGQFTEFTIVLPRTANPANKS